MELYTYILIYNLNSFKKTCCKFLHKEFLKLLAKYILSLEKVSETINNHFLLLNPASVSYNATYGDVTLFQIPPVTAFKLSCLCFLFVICFYLLSCLFFEYHIPGSIVSSLYMTFNKILFSDSLPFKAWRERSKPLFWTKSIFDTATY